MDIRYIKKSTEKISPDNMMNVITDIITKSDLEVIENYDKNKIYNKGDKVYIKEKGKHRIYLCNDETEQGEFDISNWKPYLMKDKNDLNAYPLYIYEEKVIVDRYGLFDHKINISNFKYENTSVAVFSSVTPRLRYGIDFLFTSDGVVKFLTPLYKGEKLILEIRILAGKLFNNLFKEVYVEETYIPIKRTKFVPIKYHGYRSTSKVELFDKNGKLYEEGEDYILDHNYIILKDYIEPGFIMSITIWNEVMITLTSNDYLIDEMGNYYKLNISDSAELILEDVDDENILSKGYIDLISENGILYRCRVTSDHRLTLHEVEPDTVLSTSDGQYKISINTNGELYLQDIEMNEYKNFYIISTDMSTNELCTTNNLLNIQKILSSNIGEALKNKRIISDDYNIYKIIINDEELILNLEENFYDDKPVEYINLMSPSGINFMFYATDNGNLAVRCDYIIDNNSNVLLGDNDELYYISATNDGNLHIQKTVAAQYVSEHKLITDEQCNEYEVHIDKNNQIYFLSTGKTTSDILPFVLESDAKDTYNCIYSEGKIVLNVQSQTPILKDIKTGYIYKIFVNDSLNLDIERIDSDLLEKDFIMFIRSNKQYKMIINDGNIEVIDTGILLSQKSDTEFKIKDYYGNKEYILYINDDGEPIIS